VVKPQISAAAHHTLLVRRGEQPEILAEPMLIQPYLDSVGSEGELSLFYFAGRFSHAVRKGPMLPTGAPATAALFAPEEISVRIPDAAELALAQRVLARLPFGELLYARVDLIRDAAHRPCVLELELNEPSLYLAHAPAAAEQLLAALLARLDLKSDRARAG